MPRDKLSVSSFAQDPKSDRRQSRTGYPLRICTECMTISGYIGERDPARKGYAEALKKSVKSVEDGLGQTKWQEK